MLVKSYQYPSSRDICNSQNDLMKAILSYNCDIGNQRGGNENTVGERREGQYLDITKGIINFLINAIFDELFFVRINKIALNRRQQLHSQINAYIWRGF